MHSGVVGAWDNTPALCPECDRKWARREEGSASQHRDPPVVVSNRGGHSPGVACVVLRWSFAFAELHPNGSPPESLTIKLPSC